MPSLLRSLGLASALVLGGGATLVLGAGMHPDADAVAEQVAAQRGARIVRECAACRTPSRKVRPVEVRATSMSWPPLS